MAKKKKQKSLEEVLYTDITTHSVMALAIFGLIVSGVATTLFGAGFVMAYGNELGQTDNAASVVVAIDSLVGSSTDNHGDGHMPPPASAVVVRHDEHGGVASSTISCVPLAIARSLKRGSQGDDVKQLQKNLILQGLLASSSVTGFFGALTEKAVGQWQMQQGIASSSEPDHDKGVGMVGPRTRALFAKCEGRVGQMLSNGSKGIDSDHGSSTPGMPPMPPPPMGSSTASTTPH
jgi:hypothetical protein